MLQNLSSAAVMIGSLRLIAFVYFEFLFVFIRKGMGMKLNRSQKKILRPLCQTSWNWPSSSSKAAWVSTERRSSVSGWP